MKSDLSDNYVRVARIGRPHGIRGEVTVEVFTDSPELRFVEGNVLTVKTEARTASFESLTIEKFRWNKKILLLKFVEFSDRNTAETLRDAELYAFSEDRGDDTESWYAKELAGFSVYLDTFDSDIIGEVTDLTTGAAQDLLEVALHNGQMVLVPFVEEIVPEIDDEKRVILITPPPGLLELNQE